MGRELIQSRQKKKGISLGLFYLKYFVYLFFAIALICLAAFLTLMGMVAGNMIYPADYAQEQAEKARAGIEKAITVSEDMIPDLCRYIVFDFDGNVIGGNIPDKETGTAWKAVTGQTSDYRGNYYKVIARDGQYCVLRYTIEPQYRSEKLRKYLYPPQTLIIVSTLMLILLSVIVTAVRSGHVLKKKMNSLIVVTEKIQKQDLDFSAEQSNIREINAILAAMDKMRRELKSSLESQWKAEQTRKEQISALAHDLKTPLTVVRGNAELLYDMNLTKEQAECIHYIEDSSLQMQEYVKMLIEITKSGNLYSPKFQEISLPEFVQSIQKQAKGLCSPKNIHLQFQCRSAVNSFSGDPKLLARAFGNVLSNAAEHAPPEGRVMTEVFDEAGYLVFSVSDNGSGFSGEALKYATSQFYMGDYGRNSKSHFGIGLYVADTIVKQHGGHLILENSGGEAGARVTIKIPV